MPRPYEPFADALRIAREIVRDRAGAVARAAIQADPHAYDEACNALAVRIAEALVDEGEAVASRFAGRDDRAA
ncbi:hypothetical protein [Methylobacterium pseudosasicola]|uniref:Uncharacterized protein n=1 Tax=Methylobacterium pseudosasicola TaxID=582667 RepID=A0A1I4PN25_9HYPH|nr:hypothetical protein [Methylobacterium pseudosasicola]SFM29187.1 hypothetical protein SAMN05192568_102591 [Methylobacterium pseudosasicola]